MSKSDSEFDRLLSQLSTESSQREPSKERSAEIRKECTESLTPVSSLTRWQRIGICSALALVAIGSLAVLKSGDGVHQVTRSAVYGTAGWALVLFSVLLVGFGPQGSRTSALRVTATVGVPLVFIGYLGACQTGWMPLLALLADPVHCANAARCGGLAFALGGGSAGGVMYVWRRTDPFTPQWSGALAGLVGGMAGALAIGLVCPNSDAWHLWLGHGLGVVVLVLLGARLGRTILSP